jgi:hypothetical protein
MSYSDAKSSALNWSAKSAKYITAPDGSITGFSFSDGSGSSSAFTITADMFKLIASGQSVASRNPFTVNAVTGEISFNGVVDFTNTNASGTTTIDGSKITTGSVSALQIATGAVTADKISAGAINGYTIEGIIIKGSSIEGSVIKSSWIDYSSTGDLTDWALYTLNNRPTAYDSNFAHNNDGTFVVDINSKIRLAGKARLYSIYTTQSYYSGSNGNGSINIVSDGIYPYDSYTQSNSNRCIHQYPTIINDTSKTIYSGDSSNNGSFTISFYFCNQHFEVFHTNKNNGDNPYYDIMQNIKVNGVIVCNTTDAGFSSNSFTYSNDLPLSLTFTGSSIILNAGQGVVSSGINAIGNLRNFTVTTDRVSGYSVVLPSLLYV